MKTHYPLISLTLSLLILTRASQSHALRAQSVSNILKIDQFLNQTAKWKNYQIQFLEAKLEMGSAMVMTGVLCFIAASISSAGGIGGGGLFIPILNIVGDLDLKTASCFSAFMVTGGSLANVMYHMLAPCAKFGSKTLIDYDIALLSEPCMLLGVSVGVACNLISPEWLITMLFAIFLAWSTFKTCKNGVAHWKLESEEVRSNDCGNMESGLAGDRTNNVSEVIKSAKEPLLGGQLNDKAGFPWLKLGMLVLIWLSFSALYLLRGNRSGKGIISMEPWGMEYWLLSALQIPLAIAFTSWIISRKEDSPEEVLKQQEREGSRSCMEQNKFTFPTMALLAGTFGGLFGVGGGMLISPLLLQVGIAPEITAATCSFMVFFSSTMSAFQYLLVGMEHTDTALYFAVICFIASILGLLVVQKAIQEYGRASLIVFSVSIVMALSTVLITSFGVVDVWKDFSSGRNMGFRLPI
ncbi:hypothetical protein K2173_004390 [Erythroxylum novogranatense]|uniref:Sulfite exporter TauE/SafE family protein n=1 Tax=Erythroxylum novogranatense TaxID=1862640 RepID=A0AAV8T5H4_9ROSI|nr:hypothetical protein K2173_004390 [Erythroxylum novogranatense]